VNTRSTWSGLVAQAVRITAVALIALGPCTIAAAQYSAGDLQQVRDDVAGIGRGGAPAASPPPQGPPRPPRNGDGNYDDEYGPNIDGDDWPFLLTIGAIIAGSPWWGPAVIVGDNYGRIGTFPRFPYDYGDGYLDIGLTDRPPRFEEYGQPQSFVDRIDPRPLRLRPWAGYLQIDYASNFDDLDRVSAHLLISTWRRLEIDTQADYFDEQWPGGGDQLWIGDLNATFRFAQSERVQFHSGLGVNWLEGPEPEVGFNFTYGAEFFPRKPWVLSTMVDWGTLGDAELFRFRSTAGVTVRGLGFYVGYEYLDIDRLHFNGLTSGIGIWF